MASAKNAAWAPGHSQPMAVITLVTQAFPARPLSFQPLVRPGVPREACQCYCAPSSQGGRRSPRGGLVLKDTHHRGRELWPSLVTRDRPLRRVPELPAGGDAGATACQGGRKPYGAHSCL